jgi:hypothetical protein
MNKLGVKSLSIIAITKIRVTRDNPKVMNIICNEISFIAEVLGDYTFVIKVDIISVTEKKLVQIQMWT